MTLLRYLAERQAQCEQIYLCDKASNMNYKMCMTARRRFLFRNSILIFAGILAVQAAWLLTAEFFRPTLPYFPQDKASEERASASSSAAVTAASIGWVRGDLWTDAAVALSSALINERQGGSEPQLRSRSERAAAVAHWAARLSPHDSRTWLLLAALGSRFGRPNREVANYLRMSYFTGPNELALVPIRIRVATRSMIFNDTDLRDLVAQEVRAIVLRHQNLKPSLLAAYRGASPDGKKFIETAVGDFDKNFLAAIRAGGGP